MSPFKDFPTTWQPTATVRSESQLWRGGFALSNLFLPWEPSFSPGTFFKLLYILLCNWELFFLELIFFYLKLPLFKILCCLCPFTDLDWYIKLGKSNFNFQCSKSSQNEETGSQMSFPALKLHYSREFKVFPISNISSIIKGIPHSTVWLCIVFLSLSHSKWVSLFLWIMVSFF